MFKLGRWLILTVVVLVGCGKTPDQANPTQEALSTIIANQKQMQPAPTEIFLSINAQTTPTLHPSPIFTPTIDPSITPITVDSPTLTEEPYDLDDPSLLKGDHFWLVRPFSTSRGIRDFVESAYPYGTTALGFQPHHGVDIPNPIGTTVRAVASGSVFYAGDDLHDVIFGPQQDFYGNVVVIKHEFEVPNTNGKKLTVYTLYGHMSQFYVRTGETVERFQEIGAVGQEGVAIGPHLHLEVRIGDPYDYTVTYNPNLWLQPWPGYGVLAGRVVLNNDGALADIEIEAVSQANQRIYRTFTYHYDQVNSDPWFFENYVIPDLPEGRYDVKVKYQGRIAYQAIVDIFPEKTSVVNALIE